MMAPAPAASSGRRGKTTCQHPVDIAPIDITAASLTRERYNLLNGALRRGFSAQSGGTIQIIHLDIPGSDATRQRGVTARNNPASTIAAMN